MRAVLRAFLRLHRRARLLTWSLSLRARLAWHGVRLDLHAAGLPHLADVPRLDIRTGGRGGVLRIRIEQGVRIGRDVQLQVYPGLESELVLREKAHISSGVRLILRGGLIDVGEEADVRDFVVLKCSRGVLRLAGRNTVSFGSVIHCTDSVTLEPGSSVAEHVSVLDSDHQLGGGVHVWDVPIASTPVTLGELTTVLAGSVVLRGTRTGPGCVAAAGSVLRGDYPAGSLLTGAPARVIRSLEDRVVGQPVEPAEAGASLPRGRED